MMRTGISPEVVEQFQKHINYLVETLLYAPVPYIVGRNPESVVEFVDKSLYDREHVEVIDGLAAALRHVHEAEGDLSMALFYQYDPTMSGSKPTVDPSDFYRLALNSGLYVLIIKSPLDCNSLCAELRIKPSAQQCFSSVCRREITFIDNQVNSFVERCNERYAYGLASKIGNELFSGGDDFFGTSSEWSSTTTTIRKAIGSAPPGDQGLLLLVKLKEGKPFRILEVMENTSDQGKASLSFQEWAQRNQVPRSTDVYLRESIDDPDQTWALLDHAEDFTTVTLAGLVNTLTLSDGRRVAINGSIKVAVNTPDIDIIPPPKRFVDEFLGRQSIGPTAVGDAMEESDEGATAVVVRCQEYSKEGWECYEIHVERSTPDGKRVSFTDRVSFPAATAAPVKKRLLASLQRTSLEATRYVERTFYPEEEDDDDDDDFVRFEKHDDRDENVAWGYLYPDGYVSQERRARARRAILQTMSPVVSFKEALEKKGYREYRFTDAEGYQKIVDKIVATLRTVVPLVHHHERTHYKEVSMPGIPEALKEFFFFGADFTKAPLRDPFAIDGLPQPSDDDDDDGEEHYVVKVGPFSKESAAWQLAQGLLYGYPEAVQIIDQGLGPADAVFAVLFAVYDWGEAAVKVGRAVVPHIKEGAKRGEGGFGDKVRGLFRRITFGVKKKWLQKAKGLSDEDAAELLVKMSFAQAKEHGHTDPKEALFKLNELTVNQLKLLPKDLILELNLLRLLNPAAVQALRAVAYLTAEDVLDYHARRVKNASVTLFGLPPSLIRLGKRSFKEEAEKVINLDTPVTSDDVVELVDRARRNAGIDVDEDDEDNSSSIDGHIDDYYYHRLSEEEQEILKKTERIGVVITATTALIIASAVVVISAAAIGAVGVAAGTTGAAVAPEVMAGWAKGSGGFGDSLRRSKRKIFRGVKKKWLKLVRRKSDEEIEEILAKEILEKAQNTDPQEAVNIIQTMTNADLASLPRQALEALIVSNTLTGLQVGFLLTRQPPLVTKEELKNTVYNPQYVLNLKKLSKRQLLDIPTQTLLVFMRQCVFTVAQVVFMIVANSEDPTVGVSQKQLRGFCYGKRKRRRQINKLLKREDLENYFNEKIPSDDAPIDIPSISKESLVSRELEDAYIGQVMETLLVHTSSSPVGKPLLDLLGEVQRTLASPSTTTPEIPGSKKSFHRGTMNQSPWWWRRDDRYRTRRTPPRPPADRVDRIHSLVSLHPNVLQYLLDFGSLPGAYSMWRGAAQVFISVRGARVALLRAYVFVMSPSGVASAILLPNNDRLEFQCSAAAFQPSPRSGNDFFQRRDGVRLTRIRVTTNDYSPLEALLIVSRSALAVLCNRGPFYPFFVDVQDRGDRRGNFAIQRRGDSSVRRFLSKRGFVAAPTRRRALNMKATTAAGKTSGKPREEEEEALAWPSMNLGPLEAAAAAAAAASSYIGTMMMIEDRDAWEGVDTAHLQGVYKITVSDDDDEPSLTSSGGGVVQAIMLADSIGLDFKTAATFIVTGVPGLVVRKIFKKKKKKEEALQEDILEEKSLAAAAISSEFYADNSVYGQRELRNGKMRLLLQRRKYISPRKARGILYTGRARGARITGRQRRYFTWVAGGRSSTCRQDFTREEDEFMVLDRYGRERLTPLYVHKPREEETAHASSDVKSVEVAYKRDQVVKTALSQDLNSPPLNFTWKSADGSRTLLTVGQALDFIRRSSRRLPEGELNFWKLVIYTSAASTSEDLQRAYDSPFEVTALSIPELSLYARPLMNSLELTPVLANQVRWKVEGDQRLVVDNDSSSGELSVYFDGGGGSGSHRSLSLLYFPAGKYSASLEFEQLALTADNGLEQVGDLLLLGANSTAHTAQGRIDFLRDIGEELAGEVRRNEEVRQDAGKELKAFEVPTVPSKTGRFTFSVHVNEFNEALTRVRRDTDRVYTV